MGKNGKIFVKLLLWLAAGVLICIIFIFSSQEGAVSHRISRGVIREAALHIELPDILMNLRSKTGYSYNFLLRKAAHFTIFFTFAIVLYLAFKSFVKKQIIIKTFLCCVFLAVIDECRQMFVAGRSARFADILIDAVGALCGLMLISLISCISRTVKKSGLNSKISGRLF